MQAADATRPGYISMIHLLRSLLLIAMLSLLGVAHSPLMAQEQTPPAEPSRDDAADDFDAEFDRAQVHIERRFSRQDDGDENVIIHVGDDSTLPAGQQADKVISIFGSASAAGEVREAVVAIAGNSSLTGSTGGAVVAILGDVYVDGPVGDDVVALFGDVKLGPRAVVEGEIATVGGSIVRDPAATVRGPQKQISFGDNFGRLEGLRAWFQKCFLYGRPLAFDRDVAWAWWVAFAFLGLFVLISLLFDRGVHRCVETLEARPAQAVIAAVLAVLLSPIMMALLAITLIGIPLIGLLGIGLFCAGLFGKSVVLAALGRRVTRYTGITALDHIAVATAIGGLLLMLIYTVPVICFIVYNVVGMLGVGIVIFTLILTLQVKREERTPAPAAAVSGDVTPAAGVSADSTVPPSTADLRPLAAPANIELLAMPRAGFWIRMGALLIDILLVGILVAFLDASHNIPLLLLAGYGALMWKLKGTTIGGTIFNLRVARTDGRDITWETAIVRALSCFLSILPVGLGFLWMVFDKNRQTWHDKIAGTVVVRIPS